MGLIFYLKDGDKDRGIEAFGKFLGFADPYEEILVVGDRPADHGNDSALLSGRLGTPFTVGEMVSGKNLPYPVMNGTARMTGPLATLHLLEQLHFSRSSPILPPL